MVDARIAQHSLQRLIGEISCAAINLECVIDELPQRLGAEDFEHRGFEHVIAQPPIDERGGDGRHRFHCVGSGSHAGDFLFNEFKFAEGFAKLPARVRVLNGQAKTGLCRAGTTCAESRAAKIQNRKRNF